MSPLYYFDNDLVRVDGQESMEVQQLRDGARSSRVVARCCHAVLAVDHPFYQGNVVMVPASACALSAAELPQPLARIFEDDWDADADGPLPAETPPPLDPASLPAEADPASPPWLMHLARPVEGLRQGRPLQELLSDLGPPRVLGLTEGDRFGS
jgi:hypothetical protein